MKLPFALREEFAKGNLVIFAGAGFVKNYLRKMPSWDELLTKCFAALTGDADEIMKHGDMICDQSGKTKVNPALYLKLAQKYELQRTAVNIIRRGRTEPELPCIHEMVVSEILKLYDKDKAIASVKGSKLEIAKTLPLNYWITTNYDCFLEDTYLDRTADQILARPIPSVYFRQATERRVLMKIHGSVEAPNATDSIVITEEDYYRFLRNDRYLISKLYTIFCERTVVFLGYSLNDPNIQMIYHDVLLDQPPEAASSLRPSYLLTPFRITHDDRDYYKHKNIHCIDDYEIEDFFGDLVKCFATVEAQRKGIEAKIQKQLTQYQKTLTTLLSVHTAVAKGQRYPDAPTNAADAIDRFLDLNAILVYPTQTAASLLTNVFPGVTWNDFVSAVHQTYPLIRAWGESLLQSNDTSVLEQITGYVQRQSASLSNFSVTRYLDLLFEWLMNFPRLRLRQEFIKRSCDVVFEYARTHHSWDSYVYSLNNLISVSQFVRDLSVAHQREWSKLMYQQLGNCGRSTGDSWYSIEKIYQEWHRFSPDAWPTLEATIKAQPLLTPKDEAMLSQLKPGGDYRQFLPRP